jgi:hypothetical protein
VRARAVLALLLACAPAACREVEPSRRATAPTSARATLVLEPARIGVGQVGELELAVVTPPGHALRPWTPPAEVEGVWVLDSRALPVEKTAERWVYRTRVRVRPRSAGSFVWPGGSLEVEAPDGSTSSVGWDELAVEVPSLLPEYPGRTTPFGARAPARPVTAPAAHVWAPAALGALFTLACVGLVALARARRRAAARPPPTPAPPRPPPWQAARAELGRAAELADARPFDAAHATARALRRYVQRRFGAAATGRTTEELASATPPFAATSRWPAFVSILEGLDAFRFRSDGESGARDAAAARANTLLEKARAFVDDSVPPESRS